MDPGDIIMIQALVLSTLLLAQPAQAEGRKSSMLGGRPAPKADAPKADAPQDRAAAPAGKVEPAPDPADALAKYNELREKTPHTVAAQSRLAAWCEERGLKAEAYVHYAEVVRLDPRREAAWRKLGYRKYGSRWMTEAEIAEAEELKKADRDWAPRLARIHKDIHGSNGTRKREQARESFEAIRDEKAIPSLYREFAGGQADQILMIQALDRIDRPLATRVLAMLAVYGRTPEVRRRATEILRGRSAEDYLAPLVGLLVDPLKYEVKPVGGPGSPGVLFVEGERFNVARYYAPPLPPNVAPQPGDLISYDRFGMPVITRYLGNYKVGVPGSSTLVYDFKGAEVQFSATQMMVEAQKGAAVAEAQLEGDVAQVKSINAERRHFNELVLAVAAYATGKDRGPTPKDWRDSVIGKKEEKSYGKEIKPTLTEVTPLAYQPIFSQFSFLRAGIVADS